MAPVAINSSHDTWTCLKRHRLKIDRFCQIRAAVLDETKHLRGHPLRCTETSERTWGNGFLIVVLSCLPITQNWLLHGLHVERI